MEGRQFPASEKSCRKHASAPETVSARTARTRHRRTCGGGIRRTGTHPEPPDNTGMRSGRPERPPNEKPAQTAAATARTPRTGEAGRGPGRNAGIRAPNAASNTRRDRRPCAAATGQPRRDRKPANSGSADNSPACPNDPLERKAMKKIGIFRPSHEKGGPYGPKNIRSGQRVRRSRTAGTAHCGMKV